MCDFILQITGSSRYDIQALKLNKLTILNWTRFKTKINLSESEFNILKSIIKRSYHGCNMTINGNNAILTKEIEQSAFNLLLTNFIKEHKICSKCKYPELYDNICNGCGATNNNNNNNAIIKKDKSISKKRNNEIQSLEIQPLDKEIIKQNTETIYSVIN